VSYRREQNRKARRGVTGGQLRRGQATHEARYARSLADLHPLPSLADLPPVSPDGYLRAIRLQWTPGWPGG
jgi:hypothetical protein